MSQLTAFNTQLINIIEYLNKQYPDNLQIKSYGTSIELLKMVNPRKLVEGFHEFVYPFKEEIMNNNESFFMNKDYNEELCGDSNSMLEAIQLKDLWKNMIPDVQNQIFRYFQLLCLLTEKTLNIQCNNEVVCE